MRVHDASGERKMAENLFRELEEVINDFRRKLEYPSLYRHSDAGSEAIKAHKMARRKCPHLVAPDCYGHQVYSIK